MEVSYDESADVLLIRLGRGKVVESEEIEEGVIVDYDENGKILAVEILNPKGRVDLNKLLFEKKIELPILLG